ncbi:hypothetical protein ABEG63_21255 [Chryseobacterium sp. C39-AII1]|uniref:hypothetical protein n=1 Tax=Chryseobacterium sp. C39-AII1 TaxID=3080332 RepID=UPI00320977AE
MMKSFLVSIFIFFGICLLYFFVAISKTDGNFTYVLDDAYIHLAIAKNFALHHVWGMTQYAFSSTSSSPIFTYLISICIKLFGNSALIPIFINILLMMGVIYFLTKYYSRFSDKVRFISISVLATVFASVLHLQMFSGMEHILQILLVVINIYFFTNWISSDFKNTNSLFYFYGTILLLGLVRFEMMFYFVSLAFFLAFLKKFKESILILVFGFVPILIFGYFNNLHTGHFFPNSVVVKGAHVDFGEDFFYQIKDILLTALFNRSFYKRCLLPLLLLCFVIFSDYKKRTSLQDFYKKNFFLFVWAITMLLHSVFADLKSILRYEAYLIVAFAMLIIPRLREYFIYFKFELKKNLILNILLFANIVLLISKMGFANRILVYGPKNIYEQQVQSAKFLHTYYNDSKIVANDIGAISYFTNIHLFDIAGLGSQEMIKFNEKVKNSDEDYGKYIGDFSKKNNFKIAIVYEEWLRGFVPKDWQKVAVLSVANNDIVSQTRVTIFCIDSKMKESLQNNIKTFHWNKNVKVQIFE